MSKTPDKSAVQHFAEALFNGKGTATTLEVKDAMRADGFWVEQKQVSGWMAELANEQNWDIQTGRYNTYSKVAVSTSSNSNPTTTSTVSEMLTDLFGIHKHAINSNSKLGSDLGIKDDLDIEELILAINKSHGLDLDISVDNTVGEIDDMLSKKKTY